MVNGERLMVLKWFQSSWEQAACLRPAVRTSAPAPAAWVHELVLSLRESSMVDRGEPQLTIDH
jgi:hypothetical protein